MELIWQICARLVNFLPPVIAAEEVSEDARVPISPLPTPLVSASPTESDISLPASLEASGISVPKPPSSDPACSDDAPSPPLPDVLRRSSALAVEEPSSVPWGGGNTMWQGVQVWKRYDVALSCYAVPVFVSTYMSESTHAI